eukprot:EG_transcript_32130
MSLGGPPTLRLRCPRSRSQRSRNRGTRWCQADGRDGFQSCPRTQHRTCHPPSWAFPYSLRIIFSFLKPAWGVTSFSISSCVVVNGTLNRPMLSVASGYFGRPGLTNTFAPPKS